MCTRAACALAWQIFTDWRNWHRISNRYESIKWNGTPWVAGSRIQVQILRPVKAKVDRVITMCTPGHSIAWINHVLGYSMEQWLLFDPLLEGGSRISTWLEFTGPSVKIEGRTVREVIKEYLHEWYANFRDTCDLAALHAGPQ
ncbi:MAG TPA: hypothetical protein VH596_01140 [Terriglobales bacterium]